MRTARRFDPQIAEVLLRGLPATRDLLAGPVRRGRQQQDAAGHVRHLAPQQPLGYLVRPVKTLFFSISFQIEEEKKAGSLSSQLICSPLY